MRGEGHQPRSRVEQAGGRPNHAATGARRPALGSDKNPLRQQERQTEPRRAAVPGFGPAESALLSDFVVLDWDPSSPLIRL